jgi:transcriptional regulator with XRE-family HTH domain
VDIPLLIRQRLGELGLEQKDLAAAAEVTESYISQLLARKKLPPAPGRTDIYAKIGAFLRLPEGELSRLAGIQRQMELKKKVGEPPAPLFRDCRELVLRKCRPARREEVRRVFEKDAFGELERLVTGKILDVAQDLARQECGNQVWLRRIARLCGGTYQGVRVAILELLDTDVFHISIESCVSFLDPMIEAWDIDLGTFALEIALDPGLAERTPRRFGFVETRGEAPQASEPGYQRFLEQPELSGDATPSELDFLKTLRFGGRHPTPLYYYRELQNLRDPLHFLPPPSPSGESGGGSATLSSGSGSPPPPRRPVRGNRSRSTAG